MATMNGSHVAPSAFHEPQDQRDEVVSDLGLRDRRRPEPDDRQDAEQPHPEGEARVGTGEQCDSTEHAEVEHDVGQGQVGLLVAGTVDREHERQDDDDVDREADEDGREVHRCSLVTRRGHVVLRDEQRRARR